MNLTDGLDGLAIGATLIAAATFAIFTYVAGNSVVADYLQVPYVRGVGEVAVFCGALVGASLGFLWFNATRPRSSWATSARWPSAARSARSRC